MSKTQSIIASFSKQVPSFSGDVDQFVDDHVRQICESDDKIKPHKIRAALLATYDDIKSKPNVAKLSQKVKKTPPADINTDSKLSNVSLPSKLDNSTKSKSDNDSKDKPDKDKPDKDKPDSSPKGKSDKDLVDDMFGSDDVLAGTGADQDSTDDILEELEKTKKPSKKKTTLRKKKSVKKKKDNVQATDLPLESE